MRSRAAGPEAAHLEVALPTIVAILLGVFWLGVLVTVAFTAWRLWANVKSLLAAVATLNERLAPALEELVAKSEETAEVADRLQKRQAGATWAGRRGRAGR